MNKIIVTGGTGLVGKYLQKILPNEIYLSSKDCDLRNIEDTRKIFRYHNPDTLIHLAALVGGITDNIANPVSYLEDNIYINTNTLKIAHEQQIEKVLVVLSTCTYPNKLSEDRYPLIEIDLFSGKPAETNLSYSMSKRCAAIQVETYRKQHNKNWFCVLPCNLYGEYDKFGSNSHFVSALIRKIYETKENGIIELLGTGRPLRQFMYAEDLAKAIKRLIDLNLKIYPPYINIAPFEIKSIKEIAEIGIKACKKPLEIIFNNDKSLNGQYRKDVDSSLFINLVYDFDFTSLQEGIENTYKTLFN